MRLLTVLTLSLCCLCTTANADPLVQSFKDPAFNGYGWSAHALAVHSIEESNKQANANAISSAQATAAAAAANTPLAKFISLFTSQVYAQLATQLSNNLFQTGSTAQTGSFVLDGNTISYIKTGTNVQLTVVDKAGNQTVIVVPIATFAF